MKRGVAELLCLGLCLAALAATLAGQAGAARIVGKDGVIHACYVVKGKPRGAVRLVGKKAHCKRGERKVKWSVRGPSGASGANGVDGSNGVNGQAGATGQAALETKVTELTTRVESLEGTLKGVTNEALTKAIAAVPVVESLCTQTESLTNTFNALRSGIGNLEVLGVKLGVVGLPAALASYACP